MHLRRTRRTPTERALDTAKETARDLGTKAGEAAFLLNERAQTTVIPAVEQAAKNAAERYHNEVQPLILTAATSIAATAAASAETAREEARVRAQKALTEIDRRGREALKEADKRGQQARVDALKRGLEMTEKAKSAVGVEEEPPKKTHRLRNLLIALGLAGIAAYVATKVNGDSSTQDEPVRIPTTPPPVTEVSTEADTFAEEVPPAPLATDTVVGGPTLDQDDAGVESAHASEVIAAPDDAVASQTDEDRLR
jgi:hypothetical protein